MAEDIEQPGSPAEPAPAPPPAPVARSREEVLRDPSVAAVASQFGDAIRETREFAEQITLVIDRERIREVCEAFKRDGYAYLVDLTGVDYSKFPGHAGDRFAVAYHLYDFKKNKRIRLKVFAPEGTPVPSVSSVWKTANWHERETWDMYGIVFSDHPNLERILMWDGFNGHPLRKDFPVRGIDTGARIYPEIFPPGGGPKAGSTGKDVKDVNLWKGEWTEYGRAPIAPPPPAKPAAPATPAPKPQIAAPAAVAAAPAPAPAAVPAAPAPAAVPASPAAVETSATQPEVADTELEELLEEAEFSEEDEPDA
jgi:NADH-quinone oxidoreductase subunit C